MLRSPQLGRLMRRASTLVAALVLVGCASVPPSTPTTAILADHTYVALDRPLPTPAELFALSPAMQQFVNVEFGDSVRRQDLRIRLIEALYRSPEGGGRGLKLLYEASHTRSAAEAFESRAGNCLSLVMMTAAFARHLGIEVGYQSVRTDQHYSRVGSLTLASGHVNLVLGRPAMRAFVQDAGYERLVVDFLSPAETRGQRTDPLTEETILAMYFNNRAAEWLAEGQTARAYWHAREALRHDPGFVAAANTLGVIHQRSGQLQLAEAAFRHVLDRDPMAVAALGNLVGLLRNQGRGEDVAHLEARLLALQPLPPFHWLRQGREAMARGDITRAIELFKRELRRQPEQDEVHFAIAEAHWQLGDRARAQYHLLQAAEFSTRRADQTRYENKLAKLKAQSRATTMH